MTLAVEVIHEAPKMLLRSLDAAECRACGMEPEEALARSVAGSDEAFASRLPSGDLLCSWGYHSHGPLTGVVDLWLLSTAVVEVNKVAFARESRRILRFLMETWPYAQVVVWSEHTTALRWLEWLGFEAIGGHMVGGQRFYLMQKERE